MVDDMLTILFQKVVDWRRAPRRGMGMVLICAEVHLIESER